MEDYDYSFSQNGLVAYKAGKLIGTKVTFLLKVVSNCSTARPLSIGR